MFEIRSAAPIPGEIETRDENQAPTISGYFAVFGSPYEILPGCREYVDPHAFDDTLTRDIRALCNHDTRLVLGRTSAHTLTLSVDNHGLFGTIAVNPNDGDAANLFERVKRGDVSQCSFGFCVDAEETRPYENGDMDFIIKRVTLYEVSVVTFPAYEDTSVSARSALSVRLEQIERYRKECLAAQKNALRKILKQP